MKPTELASNIPSAFGPNPPKDIHIYVSIALCYLSEHCYEARTETGMHLSDLADMKCWLAEVAAAMNLCGFPPSTEVSSQAETRTGAKVIPDYICPDCTHEHRDRNECGAYLGEGNFCHCESKVTA